MTASRDSGPHGAHGARSRLLPLTLTALGVVYGDIGTSPLYALRESFYGSHSVPPSHENVLGVLSFVLYALILIISIKYIVVVMRADNQGEGGILTLTALIPGRNGAREGTRGVALGRPILIMLGIFGAALLYGEGMITPAISILGAVEGLSVATPVFTQWVVPISVVILIGLFVIQQHGTDRVGKLFGPVMTVWFVAIALVGVTWIVRAPEVLGAINPRHGIVFFREHGWHGFTVLGTVFLVVTGGEALYADMGHFGKRPIRIAWFWMVLPALLLNYFGQGALLIVNQEATQPFFMMVPSWALLPYVALSASAAVIASQALISGAFSVTRQAIQLGYMPRLDVEHTSAREMGQIYVPQVNWGLMVCTIAITIGFGSSSRLSAAYGMGVAMAMIITTTLLHVVMTERWKWPTPLAYSVTALFATIDISFFGANLLKLPQGGWVSLFIALLLFTAMTTWKTGRRLVAERLTARAFPLEDFVSAIAATPPTRVPGTAVFMTAQPRGTPPALAHNLRYNKILHEHVVVLTVTTAPVPYVAPKDQITVQSYGHGIYNVRAQYGFMQDPHVPEALGVARGQGVDLDPEDMIYFLGRETIIVTERAGMAMWREKLFVLMARNAVRATAFFRLPPERVVELGVQVEM
jgi:KUP system potassium uptake protein